MVKDMTKKSIRNNKSLCFILNCVWYNRDKDKIFPKRINNTQKKIQLHSTFVANNQSSSDPTYSLTNVTKTATSNEMTVRLPHLYRLGIERFNPP